MKLDNLIDKVNEGYNSFDFHIVLHSIHNFYVTDMSNFYIDITKDRLYCESEKSDERRSAQTVMYIILSAVTRLIAPIISYTAEEIWGFMPHIASDNKESVFLNDMPEKSGLEFSDEFISKWDMIISAREEANKELEIKRNEKLIGKSLEANIIIHCKNDDTFSKFSAVAADLASALIVSDVSIVKDENAENDTVFEVIKAEGEKCERCWAYSKTVGSDSNHPTLCCRCAKVVK
jgi:isoleucyl-tRNA synthetase